MAKINVPNCFSNDCDCNGTPPPPPISACKPSSCNGPKCCCCDSIDIIFGVRSRCFDRVFLSCNLDGTSFEPGGEPFDPSCTECFDACDFGLEEGGRTCNQISTEPHSWWSFPPDVGPCECRCAEFGGSECNLTCVTCLNMKCQADISVIASNCSYQFEISPGSDCCGTPIGTDFETSCDCMSLQLPPGSSSIPLQYCAGGVGLDGKCLEPTSFFPIRTCINPDNSDCNCHEDLVFDVCGEVVIIEPDPDSLNLICCGELNDGAGGGCNCPGSDPGGENAEQGCCGACSDVCEFNSLQDAQQSSWCECWTKASQSIDNFVLADPSGCNSCSLDLDNVCEIRMPDGIGGFITVTRQQALDNVAAEWENCELGGDEEPPPPSIEEATCLPNCDRPDEEINIGNCSSARNPNTVVLNNGIGLVAYESFEDNNSVIRIQQFKTSVPAKLLPNRKTNFGRLEHSSKWSGNNNIAKLYYYESIPSHFINGTSSGSSPTDLTVDLIVFQSGPLENQCFPMQQGTNLGAIGTDDIGSFITFTVGSDFNLSNSFPSGDDVYNVEWFIIDSDDQGVTGDAQTGVDIPQSDFLLCDPNNNNSPCHAAVDSVIALSPHIHDGKTVPVANPSLAIAYNYMNHLENSHYVYMTYQALEDEKWNIYLRQIRLSEYSRDVQLDTSDTSGTSFIPITDTNITSNELLYRMVCIEDDCTEFGNEFLITRSVVMEILLQDGREVFNGTFFNSNDNWDSLCLGSPSGSFPKKKVFAKFTHSVIGDLCPDQFGFNDIFYNWNVGDEFTVPYGDISANSFYLLLKKPNDSAVDIGDFEVPITLGNTSIISSRAGVVWYDNIENSEWKVIDSAANAILNTYKGLDVSEPIPVTDFENGHCTNPVIKTNKNNDVFIAYECTNADLPQIHIVGTAVPTSSLPLGIFRPKNLDLSLNYFLNKGDFVYKAELTDLSDRLNQIPDMYIDDNDVVHLVWQSNRDDYWEIYYANSKNQFSQSRITKFNSKSLKPSIDGNTRGSLHITWHDNRFGNWEILMAYQDNERISTLFEQDPYLASFRNDSLGYKHFIDTATLQLQNTTNDIMCMSNLTVNFYEDRLLENFSFLITQNQWPFAFQTPNIQTDRTSNAFSYPKFTDWESKISDSFNFPFPFETLLISPEFDALISSEIEKFDIIIEILGIENIYISFRASDVSNDPSSETQWGPWLNIKSVVSSTVGSQTTTIQHRDVYRNAIHGRYKQIRINTDRGTAPSNEIFTDGIISLLKVYSISGRSCLQPGETLQAFLDLTPDIRIDAEGNEVSDIPLPISIERNKSYFISVSASTDKGPFEFGSQLSSVSCESCSSEVEKWSSESCSVSLVLHNSSSKTNYFNASFTFYTDSSRKNIVFRFDAFSNSPNLKYFTIDEGNSAEIAWGNSGYAILTKMTKKLTLWPILSNTSGLICGVKYWVETKWCSSDLENDPTGCNISDLSNNSIFEWTCDCESARWDNRFENSPSNIRDSIKWISSNNGKSDTRITESQSNTNNLNPIIKIRSDLTGIILYESNRKYLNQITESCTSDTNLYRIYASAFSIFPASNMYASGAESIRSINDILVQSDIPVEPCGGSECGDNNRCAIEGRSPSVALDQYDNLFIAFENNSDQTECNQFTENNQQTIGIHRCGAQSKNLTFKISDEESGGISAICTSEEILNKTAPIITDKIFKKIIKLARVKNEFVVYHVTRLKTPTAVVNGCNIALEIISEPDVVAIRAKNENKDQWSTWYPSSPQTGDYTFEIPWTLSSGSGIKVITIQAATYQGMSTNFTLTIIGDYSGVQHTIQFFKSTLVDPPTFESNNIITLSDAIFNDINIDNLFNVDIDGTEELNSLEGIPIAGIRPPSVENDAIVNKKGEFIFIQITPSSDYMGLFSENELLDPKNAPIFDFIQQGIDDLYFLPTIFDEPSQTFRGIVAIKVDNKLLNKDGLAFVLPHFHRDCSDSSSVSIEVDNSSQYVPDSLNVITTPTSMISGLSDSDPLIAERDPNGDIKDKIDIRSLEDPYFIFGDPDYRLKKENK